MSEGDGKGKRRERLMALRDRRKAMVGHKGNRTGMRGLWANLQEESGQQGGGGQQRSDDQERPQIRRLLKNPKVRQMIVNFLSNMDEGQGPGQGTVDDGPLKSMNLPANLGFDKMGFSEELSTSSDLEELQDYQRQLENRTDWLEAVLEQTLMELERVNRFIEARENPTGETEGEASS